MKFVMLILILSSCALYARNNCEPKSDIQRIKDCRSFLRAGFKEALMQDKGLLNAQLNLTAYKLAKLIYEKDLGSNQSDAMRALAGELLDESLLNSANNESGNLREDINQFYNENIPAAPEGLPTLETISDQYEELSDLQISQILSLNNTETSNFDQNDISTLWFVNAVNQELNNKDSFLISKALSRILAYQSDLTPLQKEKRIVDNIARSKLEMQAKLYEIKNEVFRRNKCDCIGDYNQYENAQNNSILLSCQENEDEIIANDFIAELHSVLINSPDEVKAQTELKLKFKPKAVNSHDVRKIQDYLNNPEISNHDRIVNFYKAGLYEDNGDCHSFTVIDKKSQTTSIYNIHGDKIFETNAIMARPRTGSNQVVFNPDGELREFNNGTYSRTTSAGIFYSVLDMDPVERRARKYDDEFNDRVFVLATKDEQNGQTVYDDKITVALHGVPINNYVGNANERLASFDGGNRNLSTGCVNIEGYAFDMINNLSQNHCPLYILPEDENNYFHIRNRELQFSTDIPERRKGEEVPKRCQGVVSFVDGETQCTGEWITDPNGNVNRYYYSDMSKKETITDYKVGEAKNLVLEELMDNKSDLIQNVTRSQIDEEDFSDLSALSYALSVGENNFKAVDTFKDLYNAYYKLRNQGINFERMNVEEKRMTILGYYLEPSGFQIDQGETYAPINRSKSVGEYLELSERVRFIYEQ